MDNKKLLEDFTKRIENGALELGVSKNGVDPLSRETDFIGGLGFSSIEIRNAIVKDEKSGYRITGECSSFSAGVWQTDIFYMSDSNDNWDGKFTLIDDGILFKDFFDPLLESRFIQEEVKLMLGDSILGNIIIENNSFIHFSIEQTDPSGNFILDFSNTDFSKEADVLGVNHQLATGTVDLALKTFDLEVKSIQHFTELFYPIPLNINTIGIRLCSPIEDVHSLKEDAKISSAYIYVDVLIEGPNKPCRIMCPLLQSIGNYTFFIFFEDGFAIKDGVAFIQAFFGVSSADFLALPDIFNIVVLESIVIRVADFFTAKPTTNIIEYIGIGVGTMNTWKPAVAFVTLDHISTYWEIVFGSDSNDNFISGQVEAKLILGTKEKALATLTGTVYIPNYNMKFELTNDDQVIKLNQIMNEYIGSLPASIDDKLTTYHIVVTGNISLQTFWITMEVKNIWEFKLGNHTIFISSIDAEIAYTQRQLIGKICGRIVLQNQSKKDVGFAISAEYVNPHWLFSGGIEYGTLNLTDLILGFIGINSPEWIKNITIELSKLWVTFSTETGYPFSVEAAIDCGWKITTLGLDLNLGAAIKLERIKKNQALLPYLPAGNADMVYHTKLSAYFKLSSFQVQVTAIMETEAAALYSFRVQYKDFYLLASIFNVVKEGKPQHQALKINLGGISIGGLIEYFLNFINPNMHFTLESPWDVLHKVELSKLDIIIDPTDHKISAFYRLDLNLGFAKLDQIGLVWDYRAKEDALDLLFTGNLLGMKYDENNPISWDVINESPPSIAGDTGKSLKIYYVALGQHIRGNIGDSKDITTIINTLKAQMKPIEDSVAQSSSILKALTFDENSNWIIAFDFAISNLFRVKVLFNDPYIYGLSLTIEDGSMKGLLLEILYKKITDDIGMFKGRFLLPQAYRTFQAGVFSVTIGLIDIEIYTNGNFMIDLGFPHNMNFTNSFVVQVYVFTGEGGIYFGVLNSITTNLVPSITNGQFDPVVAFGIGFKIGLGRKFSFGPLKVGATLQVLAVLEGVFARFVPTNKSSETELYYKVSGTVGIVGLVYVDLNLFVVQVSLKLEASITVSFVMECYKQIYLNFTMRISASGKIRILFIKIKFGFNIELSFSFEMGKASTTPWILGTVANNRRDIHIARRMVWGSLHKPTVNISEMNIGLGFAHFRKMYTTNEKAVIDLKILPIFSANQIGMCSESGNQVNKLAFLLFVDNQKKQSDGRLLGANIETEQENSFNQLLALISHWIMSVVAGEDITNVAVKKILTVIETKEAFDTYFSKNNIDALFTEGVSFRVSVAPKVSAEDYDGVFFPVFPEIIIENYDKTERDLSSYNMVSEEYNDFLKKYFNQLNLNEYDDDHSEKSFDYQDESFSTIIFREYFFLLAKNITDSMNTLMDEFPLELQIGINLTEICNRYNANVSPIPYCVKAGDTVESIANILLLSTRELVFLNPDLEVKLKETEIGGELPILLGMTPLSICDSNRDVKLNSVKILSLSQISISSQDDDTLLKILKISKFYSAVIVDIIDTNKDQYILKTGSTLIVKGHCYNNPNKLTKEEVAAVFYTRFFLRENEFSSWYFDAINELNKENTNTNIIFYPKTYGTIEGNTKEWKVLPDDDYQKLAFYLSWMIDTENEEYKAFKNGITEDVQGNFCFPEVRITVNEERFDHLCLRLLCDYGQLAELVKDATILKSMISIIVPNVQIKATPDMTLESFSLTLQISIEQIAFEWMDTPDIFALPQVLNLANIGSIQKEELVRTLINNNNDQIQGEVSRFFLGGLQLPTSTKGTEIKGLFELTGQQLDSPILGDTQNTSYDFCFKKQNDKAPWIIFYDSDVVTSEPMAYSESIINRNKTLQNNLLDKRGAIYLKDEITQLCYCYTLEELLNNYITGFVNPQVKKALQEAEVSTNMPLSFPLTSKVDWVNNNQLIFTVGAKQVPEEGYLTEMKFIHPEKEKTQIYFTYGFSCDVTIEKLEGSVYTLIGANDEDRNQLYALFANVAPSAIKIMYKTSLSDRKVEGLQSIVTEKSPFLIKTNLTRETKNKVTAYGNMASLPESSSDYYSSIEHPKEFLELVWQCSVVGGEGYWLQLGVELPESLFGDSEQGIIKFLVTLPDKKIYPFINCVCIETKYGVEVENAHIVCTGISKPHSLIKTGENGFRLQLVSLDDKEQLEPQDMINNLFSIISYQLLATDSYHESTISNPVLPQQGTEDDTVWDYTKSIPMSRYLANKDCSDADCLPDGSKNPYFGVTINPTELPWVQLGFVDILGNCAKLSDEYKLPLTYQYTDEIMALNIFPDIKLCYEVVEQNFLLEISSQFRMVKSAQTTDKIGAIKEKFACAYYQYKQEDVTVEITSTLLEETTPMEGFYISDYAAASYLMCGVYGQLQSKSISITEDRVTIEKISDTYVIEIEELAKCNAHQAISDLFQPGFVIPEFVSFPIDYSLKTLFNPLDDNIITEIMEQTYNLNQPLNIGVFVNIPEQTLTLDKDMTIEECLVLCNCQLEDFVAKNQSTKGIFLSGSIFIYDIFEVEITDSATISLEDVSLTFLNEHFLSVTCLELVVDKENRNEVYLAKDSTIKYSTRLTQDGDTIENFGYNTNEFIKTNINIRKLFSDGTQLLRHEHVLTEEDNQYKMPLEDIAVLYKISVEELLIYNNESVVKIGANLENNTYQDYSDTSTNLPYYIMEESLTEIAKKFKTDLTILATENLRMSIVNGNGQTIQVGSQTITLPTGIYSLQYILDMFQTPITLADLLSVIKDDNALLAKDRLFVVPPIILKSTTTCQELYEKYGMSYSELANGNVASSIIQKNVSLTVDEATVTTTDKDNLLTIQRKFFKLGLDVDLSDILFKNNQVALFKEGAILLLTTRSIAKTIPLIKEGKLATGIFEITASIIVERDTVLVHSSLQKANGFCQQSSNISPLFTKNEKGELSIDSFVVNLETSLPHIKTAFSEGNKVLWGSLFGNTGGNKGVTSLEITKGVSYNDYQLPRFYALRPLATSLETRDNVPINLLSEAGTLAEVAIPSSFSDVDLEKWGKIFLTDLETLLSATYTVPIYHSGVLYAELNDMIQCKEDLSEALTKALSLVLKIDNQVIPKAWESVRKTLKDDFRYNVIKAYNASVIAQYDVKTTSEWNEEFAPMLSGLPSFTQSTDNPTEENVATTDISAYKISLQNGISYANLVLNTNKPEMQKTISLNHINYKVTQLEHNRSKVDHDYEKSNWVQFVTSFENTEEINIDFNSDIPAPVPLRLYPNTPVLRGHRGEKAIDIPIDNRFTWDYTLRYQYDGYAQDTLKIVISLNNEKLDNMVSYKLKKDLFECLAQYVTVRDQLFTLLDENTNAMETKTREAVKSFVFMAQEIKDAWETYYGSQDDNNAAINDETKLRQLGEVKELVFAISLDIEDRHYKGLSLTTDCTTQFELPMIKAISADGTQYVMTQTKQNGEKRYLYSFEEGKEPSVSGFLDFEFTLPKLDIMIYQNAKSSLQVFRNDQILSSYGIFINNEFLYKTAIMENQSIITPHLIYTKPILIGFWSDNVSENPLQTVVDDILGSTQYMKFNVQLQFEGFIAEDTYFRTPIGYLMTDYYKSDFVENVVNTVKNWKIEKKPKLTKSRYLVSFVLFSELDEKLPILTVSYAMDETGDN